MYKYKPVLSRILIGVLILTLLSSAALATESTEKPYRQYTALGDSIPAGYGPYNYQYKGFTDIPASYPSLVAHQVAETFIPLARTGFRTVELRYMLEDDYEGDEYLFRIGKTSPEDVYRHQPEYRPAVASSDLITLGIGSNDILNYGMVRAIDAASNPVLTTKIREILEETGDYGESLSVLLNLAGSAEAVTGIVAGFVQGMTEGALHFTENWECIMNDIYSLNPDVTLVVVGMYNPLKTTKLTDVSLAPIGRAFDVITAGMNAFMSRGSKYASRYTFVDATETEIYDLPALTDSMYMDMLLGMVHPTRAGHRDIANRILNALPVPAEPIGEPVSSVEEPRFLDLSQHGVFVCGYPDGTFRPGSSATRAEVASMLCSLLTDRSAGSEAVTFPDIAGHWAEMSIRTVAALGIMSGYKDGTFRPDVAVTRAEMAVIASALFDSPAAGTAPFTDTKGHWAESSIGTAYGLGLIAGYADGSFRPDAKITRAQLTAILNEVLNRDPDEKSVEYFLPDSTFPDVAPDAWYYYDILEASTRHSYKINKDVEMWTGLSS